MDCKDVMKMIPDFLNEDLRAGNLRVLLSIWRSVRTARRN